MYFVRKIIDTLIYSNMFIGVCAVALTFTNQLSVDGSIYFDKSLGFVFFSTVFAYSLLKFRNSSDDVHTTHHYWAREHQQLSKNILLISLIASSFFFFELEKNIKFTIAALAVVTLFYGFVEIPFLKPKRKLRDFALFKTIFVAIVWSVITVIVPLKDFYIGDDIVVFLLLRRFLFILALTIPFEIKDMSGDACQNLRTIPLTFGVSNTKLLSQGILLVLILIICLQYFFFTLPLPNMLATNLSLLVSIFCIQRVKEDIGDKWYYLVLDGMMILQFVFVYLAVTFFS